MYGFPLGGKWQAKKRGVKLRLDCVTSCCSHTPGGIGKLETETMSSMQNLLIGNHCGAGFNSQLIKQIAKQF